MIDLTPLQTSIQTYENLLNGLQSTRITKKSTSHDIMKAMELKKDSEEVLKVVRNELKHVEDWFKNHPKTIAYDIKINFKAFKNQANLSLNSDLSYYDYENVVSALSRLMDLYENVMWIKLPETVPKTKKTFCITPLHGYVEAYERFTARCHEQALIHRTFFHHRYDKEKFVKALSETYRVDELKSFLYKPV